MKHIGRFTITRRQMEECPDKMVELINYISPLSNTVNYTDFSETITAISEKWFDVVEDDAEIPEYEFTIDEKQAVSCRRLDTVPVVVMAELTDNRNMYAATVVDAEPVKAPKKKAKKGKA